MTPIERTVYRNPLPDIDTIAAPAVFNAILFVLSIAQIGMITVQLVLTTSGVSYVFDACDMAATAALSCCVSVFTNVPPLVYGLFIALTLLCIPIKLFWGVIVAGLLQWQLNWQIVLDVLNLLAEHHFDPSYLSMLYIVAVSWKLIILIAAFCWNYNAVAPPPPKTYELKLAEHEYEEVAELAEHLEPTDQSVV